MPIILLHILIKNPKSFWQKIGFVPFKLGINNTHPIHIHCVSVGEFNAVKFLVDKLLKNNEKVLITNTTKTGFTACKKYYENKVLHSYFPLDFGFAIKGFLKNAQPKISIMVETEIWPNYAKFCQKKSIKLGIINGRLSKKSFKKYYKYPNFSKKVLNYFDFIATQNTQTTNYFTKLGAKNIYTLPSLKFELSVNLDEKILTNIKKITHNKKFLICASTHANEEEQIIKAYLKNKTKHLLVIMPRHPERFVEVENILKKYNITYQKQSSFTDADYEVLLADSMGELLEYFSLCDIAFIGGSLINHGGHNVLESIYFDKLTLTGEGSFNFKNIIDDLQQYQAIIEVKNADDLIEIANDYYTNNDNYQNNIQNAKQYLNKNIGASDKILELIS